MNHDEFENLVYETPSGCWEYHGTTNEMGYGALGIDNRRMYAHRYVYECMVGKIPDGMMLHHKCGNKVCVNPIHMELLTLAEHTRLHNNSTKDFCKNGHRRTEENTYILPNGKSSCRDCRELRRLDWIRRKSQFKNSS